MSFKGVVSGVFLKSGILFVVASIALVLSSCTKVNSGVGGVLKLDTDLKVVFNSTRFVNPDENEKSSPVFVRMYELASLSTIQSARFIDLYEDDKKTLAGDFITRHELQRFVPGESRTETFVLDENTRFVAFFAEFYDYKDSVYKIHFPVTNKNIFRNSVTIKINGNELILATQKNR